MDCSVGVVVPAYRPDPARLSAYVRALDDRLAPEVVRIEIDDPKPETLDRLDDLPASAELEAVPDRRGKGAAITAGFEALSTDVLAFADADGSTPADSIADVVDPVVAGTADLAAGSRRHPDATVASHQTFARRYLGDGFAFLARALLDVDLYDYQCGAKALTASTWRAIRSHLYEPGFAWDIELVAVAGALDREIVEVPVVWEDQPGSTVSPVRTSLRLGRGLLVSRHRAKVIQKNRLHSLLDARRGGEPSLVDRLARPESVDE
jgi:glycosyltransferase involved in cell wall biosynthesis